MRQQRPLGLGPIPAALTAGPVVVRQAAALLTGAFVAAGLAAMALALLIAPGTTVAAENEFTDRLAFGLFLVPAFYGVRRCLLRPRVVVEDAGVRLHNAFSSTELGWPDVADARHGTVIEVIGTDGDSTRTLVFGPAFAGPFTSDERPAELVALIRTEAARRAGRELPSSDAAPLVTDLDPEWGRGTAVHTAASIRHRRSLGLGEAAGYTAGWILACAVAAGLG